MEPTFTAKFEDIKTEQESLRSNNSNQKYPDRYVRIPETAETGYTYVVNEYKQPNGNIGFVAIFREDGATQTFQMEYKQATDETINLGWFDDPE